MHEETNYYDIINSSSALITGFEFINQANCGLGADFPFLYASDRIEAEKFTAGENMHHIASAGRLAVYRLDCENQQVLS